MKDVTVGLRTARIVRAIAAISALSVTGSIGQVRPDPQWAPDAELVKGLGPEATLDGYRIRPPAGYTEVKPEAPKGVAAFGWMGALRKDDSRPSLLVNLMTPDKQAAKATLAHVAQALLGAIKARRTAWTQSEAVSGTLDGLPFTRVRWAAFEPTRKVKMQGWVYAGRDGDTFIAIASQDVARYAATSLPLAETAARSFRRASAQVLYSVQWPDHAQMMSINAGGSGRACLTPLTDSDYYPALSPDGTTIAFTTHRDNVRAIYLMNPDGTNQRRLTTDGDAGLCCWSPDGSRLAYCSNRSGKYCIYTMKRDGSDARRISEGPSDDCPNWSPDGKTIVFESRQNQIWRILAVGADGSGATTIAAAPWSERWPRWSPSGSSLAFTSYEHGKGDIFTMRPDGSERTRMTTDPAEDRQPSWSGDGRQIIFDSNRAGHFDCYVLDVDGKVERRLTAESKDVADPVTASRHLSTGK